MVEEMLMTMQMQVALVYRQNPPGQHPPRQNSPRQKTLRQNPPRTKPPKEIRK